MTDKIPPLFEGLQRTVLGDDVVERIHTKAIELHNAAVKRSEAITAVVILATFVAFMTAIPLLIALWRWAL